MTMAVIGGLSAGSAALLSSGIGAAGAIGGAMLSNSKSTSTTNGPTNTSEKGTIKTSGFSPEIMKMLEGIIQSGQFSKGAAIDDSHNAVMGAMQDVMQQYMPDIAASQKGTGMMGDSMTQLLANQTATQAAVQGGKVQMDSINNYNSNVVNLLNSLASGQGKTETRDITTKSAPTTQATSGGMCWITSAVCEELGLPDDCQTLRVLRWFRDSYMLDTAFPERGALVEQYYGTAGAYKAALDAMLPAKRNALYTSLNTDYLQPAVLNIIAGEYDAALSVYTHMFREVQGAVLTLAPELAPAPAHAPEYVSKADLATFPATAATQNDGGV